MSRLTIPEPHISLYSDGFEASDAIDRSSTAKALSDLVERIDDPMVIALDGGWGSGKSYFLKRWVGHHLKTQETTTQTVYFDAFKHDFLDEPLVSLLNCLLERFEKLAPEEKSKSEKVKAVAWKLAPGAGRIAASIATFGASNYLDNLGDEVAEALANEVKKATTAKGFWEEAEKRHDAMTAFRQALETLTQEADGSLRKLIIVVDELDRCRPDYALAVLEIIKHFFEVDHVHFVLGVNLSELENSVKARYGAGINAALYLQKFVTLVMRLPDVTRGHTQRNLALDYLERLLNDAIFDQQQIGLIIDTLGQIKNRDSISLRSVQRLFFSLQLSKIPHGYHHQPDHADQHVLISACILKALHPRKYEILLFKDSENADLNVPSIELGEISKLFWMAAQGPDDHHRGLRNDLYHSWQYYLDPNGYSARFPETQGRTTPTRETRARQLNQLIRAHLEIFQLPPS